MGYEYNYSSYMKRIAEALEKIVRIMEEEPQPIRPWPAGKPTPPNLAEAVRQAKW